MRLFLGLGVFMVAVLTGCGGEEARPSASDVTVLVSDPTRAGMDALIAGPIKVVGGCLGLGESVVVWPPGTVVVERQPLTIRIPGQGTFSVGDQVELGGGVVSEQSSAEAKPGPSRVAGADVPAQCAKHDVWLASP